MRVMRPAPKRQKSGRLRGTIWIHNDRPTAAPKRRVVPSRSNPMNGIRLLGAKVMRFSRSGGGPKSQQSTSIDGVLSAKGGWGVDSELQWKRRGFFEATRGWGPCRS